MSDREKLIELMRQVVVEQVICSSNGHPVSRLLVRAVDEGDVDIVADHLISNGATVQKWIPVSERLPTEEDADEYETVYAISKGSYPKQWHWTKVAELHDHFTHWMPLPPEPPKECE